MTTPIFAFLFFFLFRQRSYTGRGQGFRTSRAARAGSESPIARDINGRGEGTPSQSPEESGRRKGRPQNGGELSTVSENTGRPATGRRQSSFPRVFPLSFSPICLLSSGVRLRRASLKPYSTHVVSRVTREER